MYIYIIYYIIYIYINPIEYIYTYIYIYIYVYIYSINWNSSSSNYNPICKMMLWNLFPPPSSSRNILHCFTHLTHVTHFTHVGHTDEHKSDYRRFLNGDFSKSDTSSLYSHIKSHDVNIFKFQILEILQNEAFKYTKDIHQL